MIGALEALKRAHSPKPLPAQFADFGINGGIPRGLQKLFMSHPPLDERIAALKRARVTRPASQSFANRDVLPLHAGRMLDHSASACSHRLEQDSGATHATARDVTHECQTHTASVRWRTARLLHWFDTGRSSSFEGVEAHPGADRIDWVRTTAVHPDAPGLSVRVRRSA